MRGNMKKDLYMESGTIIIKTLLPSAYRGRERKLGSAGLVIP